MEEMLKRIKEVWERRFYGSKFSFQIKEVTDPLSKKKLKKVYMRWNVREVSREHDINLTNFKGSEEEAIKQVWIMMEEEFKHVAVQMFIHPELENLSGDKVLNN